DADVGPRINLHADPPSKLKEGAKPPKDSKAVAEPGEPTTVGQAPDPSRGQKPRVASPTVKATPVKPPVPPPSSKVVAPQADRSPGFGGPGEGTAVGLAPALDAPPSPGPRSSPAVPTSKPTTRVSTRQIAAAIGDRPLTRQCASCNALYPEDF